ncbi:hypothetical protein ABZ733_23105, partial [Streptomyces longwoodensis]|uniref:hypothetical protein n=1 Tax=Streptomyces longwoodensis TaxID=68231 RepID=UPI0033EEA270
MSVTGFFSAHCDVEGAAVPGEVDPLAYGVSCRSGRTDFGGRDNRNPRTNTEHPPQTPTEGLAGVGVLG